MVICSPGVWFSFANTGGLGQEKIEEDFRRVPLPELGARAAQLVKNILFIHRQEAAVVAVETILRRSPAAAVTVVSAISKAAPETAPAVVAAASRLSPASSEHMIIARQKFSSQFPGSNPRYTSFLEAGLGRCNGVSNSGLSNNGVKTPDAGRGST